MTKFKTAQEDFWAGEFGSQYIQRNYPDCEISARLALFTKIIARTSQVDSIIELGANVGNNLKVLDQLKPNAELAAVEINSDAVRYLKDWGRATVHHNSILEYASERSYDLSLISGVLIHLAPDALPLAYNLLHKLSQRYICLIEYYNPTPVEINYRGHNGKLFKRDFAGEMLDRFSDLKLMDYGFVYHRDNHFPLDDLTWFLLEKR